jgi:hypothetical protein
MQLNTLSERHLPVINTTIVSSMSKMSYSYLKTPNISETGFYLRQQVKLTQLG